jgi:hypothetical protein
MPIQRSESTSAADEDDEMLDGESQGESLHRSVSVSNVPNSTDVSVLHRFVNHYVVRYCLRIRDALRSLIGSQPHNPSLVSTPPSSQTRAALEILDTIQKTPFNSEADDHEASLKELWGLLGDGSEYRRNGGHWGLLGFQGKDPATDFRGQVCVICFLPFCAGPSQ